MGTPSSWALRPEYRDPETGRFHARRKSVAETSAPSVPAEAGRMHWSWRVGRFAGIDVYIHATFLILIAWLLMIHFSQGSTITETAIGILFVLTLFGCVVLHEFGHALTARHYGVKTRDITLLPIGGVARLERIPKEPVQELLVALAGPAVNVVIAAVLYGCALLLAGVDAYIPQTILPGSREPLNPLIALMNINIALVVFNMLPAFPMDGGRVLRALLAMVIPRVQATRIASGLGQVMAGIFALIGLQIGHPFLLFIALFVYLGAKQEYQTTRWEAAVEGLKVRDAMMTNFRTLIADDPLSRAVTILLQGSQHDFPVLDNDFHVVGLLLRQDLIQALNKEGGSTLPVSKAMRRISCSASPDESLETAFQRMQSAQLPVLPVFDAEGKLAGLLSTENVAEIIMVKNAMEHAAIRPGLPA